MAEKALTAVIQEAYVQGISTRSVDEVKAMGISGLSRSQVSRLCEEIDGKVKAFLEQPTLCEHQGCGMDAGWGICQAEAVAALVLLRAPRRKGGLSVINQPRREGNYADREIDCQQAMEPGFQAIIDCMVEAGWTREEAKRSLRRLVAADNMTQKENARVEAELAIARAIMRAGKNLLRRLR